MRVEDVDELAAGLDGVTRSTSGGLVAWRYRGRLVARQLDDESLVIRAALDVRGSLLRRHPGTFSVPPRFRSHMMVVADLARGDRGAIEDALRAAWDLQRRGGA